jgi:hypothetical protein
MRSSRRNVTISVLQSLLTSLVVTQLDYCNTVSIWTTGRSNLSATVDSAAPRMFFKLRRPEHFGDALICLHGLPIQDGGFFCISVYLLVRKSKQLCQGQALTGITIEYSIKINFASSPVHTKDKSTDNNYSSLCCSKSV